VSTRRVVESVVHVNVDVTDDYTSDERHRTSRTSAMSTKKVSLGGDVGGR